MNLTPAATVAYATDLRPEHLGEHVRITTVVTEQNAAKGLGELGATVTVTGTIYGVKNLTQPVTGHQCVRLLLSLTRPDTVLEFTLGRNNPARLINEG